MRNRYPIFLDVVITKKCNLNCKYCNSNAPIACRNLEYDWEQFKKDVDHLASIDTFWVPLIMGGEPFCNARIFEYAEYLRSYDLPVVIFTNGKYLVHADDTVYKKMVDLKLSLMITRYIYSDIDYTTVYDRCFKFGVPIIRDGGDVLYSVGEHPNNHSRHLFLCRDVMQRWLLQEKENENPDATFPRGCMPRNIPNNSPTCLKLMNGIIYHGLCMPTLIDIDTTFGTDYASQLIKGKDYTVVSEMTEPVLNLDEVKFCNRFCKRYTDIKWSTSDKSRNEFIYDGDGSDIHYASI